MYGQNPFTEKQQWGPIIESLLFPMVQMLMAKKMGGDDQSGRKMYGAQTPMMSGAPQTGMAGNMMGQPQGQPMGQPVQKPISQKPPQYSGVSGGMGGATDPQAIQQIFSELSPQSQQILIGLLQSGSFKMGR